MKLKLRYDCILPFSILVVFLAAIENGGYFEDFHRPKFSYSQLLYSLLACIYLNQASNLQGPILCRVSRKFVRYKNLDLRPMREYICV